MARGAEPDLQLEPRGTWRPMGGGSICEVHRARSTDGRTVVVKHTPYPAAMEAEGLTAMAAAGAPVPEVLRVGAHELVLAHVAGPPDWPALGRRLATMHRSTAEAFGWPTENRIGPEVQVNLQDPDWPTFYAERRVRPFLDDLPAGPRRRLSNAIDGPMRRLLASGSPPSLVHGDLWAGNVVDGRWLIDPAVHHADRELDLAVTGLFGGFDEAFHQAYRETWPLPDGWRERRPALQLYHLLLHVRLFGSGYVSSVVQRLDALGW